MDQPENIKTSEPKREQGEVDSLCGRTKEQQAREILDRLNYFYLQTDGTMKWPNSSEGDLLKMVYALLTA